MFFHISLKRDELDNVTLFKRLVKPYVVEVDLTQETYNVAIC